MTIKSKVGLMLFLCFKLFIVVFTLISCSPKKLLPDKLTAYIQDEANGLKQTQAIGNFKYTITYRPIDLIVWQEIGNKGKREDSVIANLRKNYEQYNYFILNISAAGKDALYGASGSMEAFSQNLQNLSYHMTQYSYAVTEKKDTLTLKDFYFPRLYGMGGGTQVMLVYNRTKDPGEYTDIYIEDIGLGTGRQKFRFKKEDMESVPALDYQI